MIFIYRKGQLLGGEILITYNKGRTISKRRGLVIGYKTIQVQFYVHSQWLHTSWFVNPPSFVFRNFSSHVGPPPMFNYFVNSVKSAKCRVTVVLQFEMS